MKIKKETYKVFTSQGWKSYEGSVGYDYPFMCHRGKGEKTWRVSHMSCGYSITSASKLQEAKKKIQELKAFPLFLMPTFETITKQQQLLKKQSPKEYKKILSIINR